VILKISPNGSRVILAYFVDLESAKDRLDRYGDPGTVEAKEITDTEVKAMVAKQKSRREEWLKAR
jgi:hypothetical protein